MKHLLFLFTLLLSFIASAQPSIEYKPGRTDSARWELRRITPAGDTAIYLGTYDTLPNILDYGRTLYVSGGFIGGGRINSNDDFYTDEVKAFMRAQSAIADEERFQVVQEVFLIEGVSGFIPSFDTITNRSFVGRWSTNSDCGMPTPVVDIEIDDPIATLWSIVAKEDGDTASFATVATLGPGVVAINSPTFGFEIVLVQTNEDLWQAAYGCKFSRQ